MKASRDCTGVDSGSFPERSSFRSRKKAASDGVGGGGVGPLLLAGVLFERIEVQTNLLVLELVGLDALLGGLFGERLDRALAPIARRPRARARPLELLLLLALTPFGDHLGTIDELALLRSRLGDGPRPFSALFDDLAAFEGALATRRLPFELAFA